MKKSELKQLIKEEIRKVVSEIDPETIGKRVIPKRKKLSDKTGGFDKYDTRSRETLKKSINSVFSKFLNNKNLPFAFKESNSPSENHYYLSKAFYDVYEEGEAAGYLQFSEVDKGDKVNPKTISFRYEISDINPDKRDRSQSSNKVYVKNDNESEDDYGRRWVLASDGITLATVSDVYTDKIENMSGGENLEMSTFTAKFLVNAVNKFTRMFFSAYPILNKNGNKVIPKSKITRSTFPQFNYSLKK